MIGASDIHLGPCGDLLDQSLRAGFRAFAAQRASFVRDACITLLRQITRVMVAMLYARPRAHTSDGTRLSSARKKFHRGAIAVSVIIVFIFTSATAVATYDTGHLLPFVHGAENRRDLILIHLACGVARGQVGLAVHQRFRKCGTAGITASAAIRAGQ